MKEIEMEEENTIPLCDLLVRTTYQTQSTHPSDIGCKKPLAYGCGFIIRYKQKCFFVTADHNVHPEDYDDEHRIYQRTGIDYRVSIFNNMHSPEDFLSTVITPLEGFYYMERFDIRKPEEIPELMDITLCIMKPINFQCPFLTDEVSFGDYTVKTEQQKLPILEEMLAEPKEGLNYFIYGKIRHDMKSVRLYRQDTIKKELKYITKSNDFLVLHYPEVIEDYDDWSGLSGSPVISEEGDCIGVLCSVTVNSQCVYVMPIDKIKMLMDIAISQELLEELKNRDTDKC